MLLEKNYHPAFQFFHQRSFCKYVFLSLLDPFRRNKIPNALSDVLELIIKKISSIKDRYRSKWTERVDYFEAKNLSVVSLNSLHSCWLLLIIIRIWSNLKHFMVFKKIGFSLYEIFDQKSKFYKCVFLRSLDSFRRNKLPNALTQHFVSVIRAINNRDRSKTTQNERKMLIISKLKI